MPTDAPAPAPSSFADIPREVACRLSRGERVALILLDGLGLEFLDRHQDHPLVQRLEITPLRSQFPSTTTAHVTTMHYGVPVEQHGLYEWNVLEPTLDEIICPLRWNAAGDDEEGALGDRLQADALAPGLTLYEQVERRCTVLQPRAIENSRYTRMATQGAAVHGFDQLPAGLRDLTAEMTGPDAPVYAFLYWDAIDRAGHEQGPASDAFETASRHALDAVHDALREPPDGTTVLITADHGQVEVSPDRVDYLDELWPELPAHLTQARPAGSSRDAFLHVHPEHVETVVQQLADKLGAAAIVCPARELFSDIGPRLQRRLGDVAVLPGPGRQAWLRGAPANERWFRGQHGGLTDAECSTYLARVVR